MDIKGVQLETLGYFQFQHAMHWSNFTQIKVFYQKLMKYLIANGRDLGLAKKEALHENNFDQLENIIEYEEFLG